MRYTKLFWILWRKEINYWVRMWELRKKISTVIGKIISWPILCILITPFHYAFSLAHFLFETFLFVTDRKQFEYNIKEHAKKFIEEVE